MYDELGALCWLLAPSVKITEENPFWRVRKQVSWVIFSPGDHAIPYISVIVANLFRHIWMPLKTKRKLVRSQVSLVLMGLLA